jgi:hypothetical protein
MGAYEIVLQYCPTLTGLRAQKGAFFNAASSQGIALLFPDTSPRGAGIEGEDLDWDFGTGAGFYLDSTNPKYSKHYNMLTHITLELPQIIEAAGIPIVCHLPSSLCSRCAQIRWLQGLYKAEHLWTFYGRSWSSYAVPCLQNQAIQICIRVFTHLEPYKMFLG